MGSAARCRSAACTDRPSSPLAPGARRSTAMTRPFAAARLAALVYVSVIVIVVGVALVAGAVLDQQTVEDLRRVPFPRLPMSLGEAASIWMHNGRILLAAVGAAVAVN